MGSKYKTLTTLLNKEFTSKYGEVFKVIHYENNEEVTIQYVDGTIVKTKSVNIRNGYPPNPNRPIVNGKGYHGIGPYKISDANGKTHAYVKWHGMLYRVHEGNSCQDKPRTACYNGVHVADEWNNFQNFAGWYHTAVEKYNCEDTLCLDKDLLSPGTKLYSKETCCLLPYKLNIAIQVASTIYFDTQRNKFRPKITVYGGSTRRGVGDFKSEADAWEAYFKVKDSYVKEISLSYKNKIPNYVFEALVNFNSKDVYEKTKQRYC